MRLLAPVFAIARVTFSGILRDRILYSIALVGFLLLGVAVLASQLTFIGPARVVLDVGLAAVSISLAFIGIFLGASALNHEFERRTAYVALSRPISRGQFLCGKYLGIAGALGLNWLLLSGVYLLLLVSMSGLGADEIWVRLGSTLGLGLLFAWLQSLVLASIALAFSALSSTAVSVFCGIGVYLVGVNVPEIRLIAAKAASSLLRTTLQGVASAFPDLAAFSLGTKITYDLPVSSVYAWTTLGYAALWVALALGVGSVLVHTKEN